MAEPGIQLAELIDAIRRELEVAASKARKDRLQFEVQDVQLEVEVTTTKSGEGGGDLKVMVVSFGGRRSRANSSTQKVTLRVTPVTAAGTKFKVTDTPAVPVPDV